MVVGVVVGMVIVLTDHCAHRGTPAVILMLAELAELA
jgi:hypothetical protein